MLPPCSLQEVMRGPVLCIDGHSYERDAITAWLAAGNAVSPVTAQPLSHAMLVPNHTLRSIIAALLAQPAA